MTIDILPTLARIAGAEPPHHTIDGLDIWPLLSGEAGARSPHDAYYFYWNDGLEAVRSGRWKMHLPHAYPTLAGRPGGSGGKPAKYENTRTGVALYDLERDVGERNDLALQYPEVVERLTKAGGMFDEALKKNRREPGHSA